MAAKFTIKTAVAGARGGVEELSDIETLRGVMNLVRQITYDLKPVWERIAPIIVDSIQNRIDESGKGEAIEWEPLSQKTIKKKEMMGYEDVANKPLLMTGEMRDSIRVTKSTTFDLRVTATDPKAYKHQYGGTGSDPETGNEFDIPPRPFMHMSPNITKRVFDELLGFVNDALAGESKDISGIVGPQTQMLEHPTVVSEQLLLDLEIEMKKRGTPF